MYLINILTNIYLIICTLTIRYTKNKKKDERNERKLVNEMDDGGKQTS